MSESCQNCQKVARKMVKRVKKVARNFPESCQKVAKKVSKTFQKVDRKLQKKGCQKVARKLSEICQKVLRKFSENSQKVFRKFWESHEKVTRKSWDSHETVLRQYWDSHETIYNSTPVAAMLALTQPLIINRPCEAGAVQTALSLIHSLIQSVHEPFPPDLQNILTPKPLELESWFFLENFNPTPCVTRHVSRVTCHVSRVTCHVSPVTCKKNQQQKHLNFFIKQKKLDNVVELVGGASRWRVCYQQSQRLQDFFVFTNSWFLIKKKVRKSMVENECNMASLVFTGWLVTTPWMPGLPTPKLYWKLQCTL